MQEERKFLSILRRIDRLALREKLEGLLPQSERDESPKDVLNLTADYGAGHRRASSALGEAIKELRPDISILTLNYIKFVHPVLDQITQSLYVNTVKVAPELYRGFYYVTKSIDPDSVWQYALNHLGHRKLLRLLQKVQPRLVLCTFPTPAGVVGELKRRGLIDVPQVTVITDNAVHTQWVSPWTDLYIVASDWVKDGLVKRGIPPEKIEVTGIPIDLRFACHWDKEALRKKYGLDRDLPVVLILGSAYGMTADAWETAAWLGDLHVPCQVLVVAGYDKSLKAKCEEATRGSRNPVKVFGYVDTMHELMAVSDIAVTKAGGLTVSEALACGLPLVIHRPIPGQEEENSKFLIQHGAGLVSKNPCTTRELVLMLLQNETTRNEMARAAKSLGRPNSARDAAKAILTRFSERLMPNGPRQTYRS
ncbi:MAG: glycosyltransferase [Candidatus Fermentithermobacillus carboniphilus]|uniref:Glycosyltransferase n=1 Tax=Candidatus Fermentithermobacillus carboniphilus TaxID=3085328 RepID=A0AAT9LE04_9FIRM|nr:MAG: glycosyltransferase [Candidatus Fermentithermobacillus carboniphilus]